MKLLVTALLIATASDDFVKPEVSIAREYLQPVGMPVVAVYHHIKENHFLNMHHTDATGLEALGDFFLTPSRYLFGGKDISLQKGHCEIRPSFAYEGYVWLKTTLSILALPLSEIFGCAFKGASLLSTENYEHYRVVNASLENQTLVPQEASYREKGIGQIHSDEWAPCLGYQRPSLLPEVHQLELEALKEVCKLFEEYGIIYWIDCGTCLGAYRYGGMIPWDDDIDISILGQDHDNVKRVLKKLDPTRFQVQDWSSYKYPKTFMKLYLKETKTLIDIYHYEIDASARTIAYFYSYKDSPLPEAWKRCEIVMTKPLSYETVFPLKRAYLDGILVWVPHQIVPFLNSKYGDNLEPTMVWDEAAKAYLKVKNHPYWKIFTQEP